MSAQRARRRQLTLALLLTAAVLLAIWQRCGKRDAPSAPLAASTEAPSERPPARDLRLTRGDRQPVALTRGTITDSGDAVGKLEGRVVSSGDGRPIAGAKLSFAAASMFSVASDQDGRFVFAPEREDSYVLVLATAGGYLPFAPEWGHSPLVFQARRGRGLSGAEVRLTPAIDYTARVLSPNGERVAGAKVEVLGGPAEGASLAAASAASTTGAEGEAIFHAPDNAIVQASHPDYGSARGAVDFSVQVSKLLTLRLRDRADEPARAAIAGRVVDEQGAGVADAVVEARLGERGPERQPFPAVRIAAREDGHFELADLVEGDYVLTATAPGFAPRALRGVPAPSSDVRLVLTAGQALFGQVTDAADGAPVPSFAVVVRERLGPLERDVLTVESFFDAEGRYEIPHLPDGDYEVSASALGFAASGERTVHLAGRDVEADFSLRRGGVVRGLVQDAVSKVPIEGAKISLEGATGGAEASVAMVTTARSDTAGRFELAGIGDRMQSIFVAAADHHGRIISGIRVADGQATEIVVGLTPTEEGEEPRIELAGIGAVLSARGDALEIGAVIEGGGAAEAGLASGDAILAVGGVSVTELGFEGAINAIRGPEGSTVTLLIRKPDAADPVVVPVVRRRIRS